MAIQVSPSPFPNSNADNLVSSFLDRDAYLSELLNNLQSNVQTDLDLSVQTKFPWLQEVRERAVNWVRHSTIPTTREEEWRFTDLSALKQVQFHRVEIHHDNNVETLHASLQVTQPEYFNRLVFVNGIYAPELSAIADLPDRIIVSNLSNLPAEYGEKIQQYLAQSEGALEVFTALNTAGINDVAVVWVPKNTVVEKPIHLLYLNAADQPIISQPRCLVVAESGSEVTLVEEYGNPKSLEGNKEKLEQESVYFNNAVSEIWVEDNASVNHTRVVREAAGAFHIGKTAVTQARYSRYTCNAVTFGGKLSRHNLEILQTGEQTETTLNGLTVISVNQLADTHSAIALNYPYGKSQQLHKTIVGDKAHSIFNGKIIVPKAAQLTDASQLNRNLLLSSKARVDTKPQLEITADNVKCAHGATVSQLEDDEIFYLQSRGIDENAARHLLIDAFATEIIKQIPVASLQESLIQSVNQIGA